MKIFFEGKRGAILITLVLQFLLTATVYSFPPAPHHLIYGMVRDEFGNPISDPTAEIILETSSGVQIRSTIVPNLESGVNYRLAVPIDAGLTSDAYKPTALKPLVSFRIRVKIGETTYLPIEMVADFSKLGKPAQKTRLNLTLGEDSDGDGLPDAWERMLIAASGEDLMLTDISPYDDFDGDGISNLNEYLAGTYAFDPQDGFRLNIVSVWGRKPYLEFMVIQGRTYTLLGSPDLKTWTPIDFRILANGPTAASQASYRATDVHLLQVEPVPGNAQPVANYFKVQAQ
jgi:hypothetical protein